MKKLSEILVDKGWALPEGKGAVTLDTTHFRQIIKISLDVDFDWMQIGCVGLGCNGGGSFTLVRDESKYFIWPVNTYLDGSDWKYILYLDAKIKDKILRFDFYHVSNRVIDFPISIHTYLTPTKCSCEVNILNHNCNCRSKDKLHGHSDLRGVSFFEKYMSKTMLETKGFYI